METGKPLLSQLLPIVAAFFVAGSSEYHDRMGQGADQGVLKKVLMHEGIQSLERSQTKEDFQVEQSFLAVIAGWFPIIVLIAVWIIFMRKHRSTQTATIDYMKKQVELTERMAAAMERIAETVEKK